MPGAGLLACLLNPLGVVGLEFLQVIYDQVGVQSGVYFQSFLLILLQLAVVQSSNLLQFLFSFINLRLHKIFFGVSYTCNLLFICFIAETIYLVNLQSVRHNRLNGISKILNVNSEFKGTNQINSKQNRVEQRGSRVAWLRRAGWELALLLAAAPLLAAPLACLILISDYLIENRKSWEYNVFRLLNGLLAAGFFGLAELASLAFQKLNGRIARV